MTDGDGPVTGRVPSVYQTRHQHLCAVLRGVLVEAVQAGRRAAGGIGTVPYRAIAALYLILMNHPVDRRGRCQSCRRPGALLGRCQRRCRVHGEAGVWLHQPAEFLRAQLVRELGLTVASPATDIAPDRPSPPDQAPAGRMVSPLAGPDLFAWMALHRVHGGHVAKLGSRYLDGGRPVPCSLPAALDDLVTAGLVTLAEPDPMASGMCRVTATEAGHTRYAALCRQERQAALRVPAPQLGTPQTRTTENPVRPPV